jgi:hypothetical protein
MENKKKEKVKRKQVKVYQFDFDHVMYDGNNDLYVLDEYKKEIGNSDGISFDQFEKTVGKKYKAGDLIKELIVIKCPQIKENHTEKVEKYNQIIKSGVYYNGHLYKRSTKSAAMGRSQRIELIRNDYRNEFWLRSSMGLIPKETVFSKWDTAIGNCRASAIKIPYIPRIIVIDDYETDITETIEKVVPCHEDSEEKQLMLKEKELMSTYFKNKKEIMLPKEEMNKKLAKLDPYSNQGTYKTFSTWWRENRRVKLDEINNPKAAYYNLYFDKKYPAYTKDQTEKIPELKITESSLGYKVETHENYTVKKVPFFDGQGLMSINFAKLLTEHLGESQTITCCQGRLPYLKGNFVTFPIIEWCKKNKVKQIKDVFGNWQQIIDKDGREVDLIVTKSCFKMWHEYKDSPNGKPQPLVSSVEEYIKLLEEYDYTYFGVANYSKPKWKMKEWTNLTYQTIHALNLTYEQLGELAKPFLEVIINVTKGNRVELEDGTSRYEIDAAYVKAFLNMVAAEKTEKEDNEDEFIDDSELDIEEQDDEIEILNMNTNAQKAIDVHEGMLYDIKVKSYIKKQAMNKVKEMLRGRIPVKGSRYYITCDPQAFMEHAAGREVKGYLKKGEMFRKGFVGESVLTRDPITMYSEIAKVNFVDVKDKYWNMYDNIIIMNVHDLTAVKLAGADWDGDCVSQIEEPIIINAVVDSPTIINEEDKKTAKPTKNNIDAMLAFEKMCMSNLTGRVTNINSYFQNLAFEQGDITKQKLVNACCKMLQGRILDSTKLGTHVEIPYVLEQYADKKPYYFRHVYGGTKDNYSYDVKTPFNKFCQTLENWMLKRFKMKDGKFIVSEYGHRTTKDILQDESKYSQAQLFEYKELLKPEYRKYNNERSKINLELKNFNKKKKFDQDEKVKKEIKDKYAKLEERTIAACRKLIPNSSILASTAVELSYGEYSTYNFAWLFFDGLVENLEANLTSNIKTDVRKVHRLSNCQEDYNGKILTVKDGLATVENKKFKVDFPDGEYELFSIMGQYFIKYQSERESKVEGSCSPSLHDGRSTRREVNDYTIQFRLPKGSPDIEEVTADVLGKTYEIKVKNIYPDIFDGDNLKLMISTDFIEVDENTSLKDFDGATIRIKAILRKWNKSFEAIVDII